MKYLAVILGLATSTAFSQPTADWLQMAKVNVIANATADATSITTLLSRNLYVDDFGAVGDGVTDDFKAFKAALVACAAKGGGSVYLSAKQYLIDSADLEVVSDCHMVGSTDQLGQRIANNYLTSPYTIVVNPSYTVLLKDRAGLHGVIVRRKGMKVMSNVRDVVNGVAAFSGIGVTCAGMDCSVSNSMILGFSTGFSSSNHPRPYIQDFYGDNTNCILIDHAHDVGRIHNAHAFPFVTVNLGFNIASYAVSNIVDNGQGTYRVTTSLPNDIITGDVVNLYNQVGAESGVNRWVATSVNATTVDLKGSSPTTKTRATWASGDVQLVVGSATNLAIGQTVTGVSIASGTVVSYVYPEKKIVYLSKPTVGPGLNTALAFADTVYVSGGLLTINGNRRNGAAFTVSNSETAEVSNAFSFGYDTGFSVAGSTIGSQIVNFSADSNAMADPNTKGIVFTGTGWGNQFSNANIASTAIGIQQLSTGNPANQINGITFNSNIGARALDFQTGRLNVSDAQVINKVNITVAATAGRLSLIGGDYRLTTQWFENAAAKSKLTTMATGLAGSSSFTNGVGLSIPAATYQDTGSLTADTNTNGIYYFGQPTLTSTVAKKYSGVVSTIYCAGAPLAGGNVTFSLTPRCAYFDGSIQVDGPLAATKGGDWSGGVISINSNGANNFPTSINAGTSNSDVTIGSGSNRMIVHGGQVGAVRNLTDAEAVELKDFDFHVCINKSTGSATVAKLPKSPIVGQTLDISDCKGDAATHAITVVPASGSIDGATTYVINTNYGSWTGYYTGTIWKTTSSR